MNDAVKEYRKYLLLFDLLGYDKIDQVIKDGKLLYVHFSGNNDGRWTYFDLRTRR